MQGIGWQRSCLACGQARARQLSAERARRVTRGADRGLEIRRVTLVWHPDDSLIDSEHMRAKAQPPGTVQGVLDHRVELSDRVVDVIQQVPAQDADADKTDGRQREAD